MADQRFTGLPLEELRAMAMRGDPEAAGLAGQRLDRAGAALHQVAADLERTAERIGLGWRGSAAGAARTGIAGHAGWAMTTGGRSAAAGAAAHAQADSARHVRRNMPDPATLPPRSVSAGHPAGVDPARVDLAGADEAWHNAQRRAAELLDGHAANSRAQLPPGSASGPAVPGGGQPSRSATVDGMIAVAGGGVPVGRLPAAAGEAVPVVAAVAGPPVAGPGPAVATPAGPAAGGPAVPALGLPGGPAGGRAPTGGFVRSGVGVGGGTTGSGRVVRPLDAGGRTGHGATGSPVQVRPAWFAPRGGEPSAGAACTGAPGGPSTSGPGTGLSGRDDSGATAAPAAPLVPPAGGQPAYSEHARLGFLLDVDETFDGDEPVSPPVLGS